MTSNNQILRKKQTNSKYQDKMISKAVIGARMLSHEEGRGSGHHDKFACCTLQGNPATGEDVSGMILFAQSEGSCMRAFGQLTVNDGSIDLEAEETDEIWRSLAITENAFDGQNCDNNGGVFDPHESYMGLQDICFDKTGAGGYFHRDDQLTLCGDETIIGRSVSFYG